LLSSGIVRRITAYAARWIVASRRVAGIAIINIVTAAAARVVDIYMVL
jgi:hypothetical protein